MVKPIYKCPVAQPQAIEKGGPVLAISAQAAHIEGRLVEHPRVRLARHAHALPVLEKIPEGATCLISRAAAEGDVSPSGISQLGKLHGAKNSLGSRIIHKRLPLDVMGVIFGALSDNPGGADQSFSQYSADSFSVGDHFQELHIGLVILFLGFQTMQLRFADNPLAIKGDHKGNKRKEIHPVHTIPVEHR